MKPSKPSKSTLYLGIFLLLAGIVAGSRGIVEISRGQYEKAMVTSYGAQFVIAAALALIVYWVYRRSR